MEVKVQFNLNIPINDVSVQELREWFDYYIYRCGSLKMDNPMSKFDFNECIVDKSLKVLPGIGLRLDKP